MRTHFRGLIIMWMIVNRSWSAHLAESTRSCPAQETFASVKIWTPGWSSSSARSKFSVRAYPVSELKIINSISLRHLAPVNTVESREHCSNQPTLSVPSGAVDQELYNNNASVQEQPVEPCNLRETQSETPVEAKMTLLWIANHRYGDRLATLQHKLLKQGTNPPSIFFSGWECYEFCSILYMFIFTDDKSYIDPNTKLYSKHI